MLPRNEVGSIGREVWWSDMFRSCDVRAVAWVRRFGRAGRGRY